MQINRTIHIKYYAPLCSWAFFTVLFLLFLSIAVPFYLSFGGQTFWNNYKIRPISARIQPTGQYLLILHENGGIKYYTNGIHSQAKQNFQLSVESTQKQKIRVDLSTDESIESIQKAQLYLMLQIINNTDTPKLNINTIALLTSQINSAGQIHFIGTLRLSSDTVFTSVTQNNFTFDFFKNATMKQSIFEDFNEMYYKLPYKVTTTTTKINYRAKSGFKRIYINLNVSPFQSIIIKPNYLQSLKDNWVMYLSIFLPSLIMLDILLSTILAKGFLQAKCFIQQ